MLLQACGFMQQAEIPQRLDLVDFPGISGFGYSYFQSQEVVFSSD